MAVDRIVFSVVGLAAALTGVAALPSAAAPPSSRQSAIEVGSVELVRPAIAVYGREAGQPVYFVFLRLNRAVPRNSNGSPAAAVRLGGLGLGHAPTSSSMGFLTVPSSGGRHCYEQQLVLPEGHFPSIMARPRPGLRLPVEVPVRGLAEPLETTVSLRRRIDRASGAEPYLRELMCHSRPPPVVNTS